MKLRPLKNDQDYEALLAWLDGQLDRPGPPDSPTGEDVPVALLLVKAYKDQQYPIPAPDPVAAIQLKMAGQRLRPDDLVGRIGSKSDVSAILNRQKLLTRATARFFHQPLHIPARVLLS